MTSMGGGGGGTEAFNAYLIKNSKGKGEGGQEKNKKKERKNMKKRGEVGGTLTSSRKDWAELYGCIK